MGFGGNSEQDVGYTGRRGCCGAVDEGCNPPTPLRRRSRSLAVAGVAADGMRRHLGEGDASELFAGAGPV